MSPQLVKLTNTLRSKKKMCQGSHPDQDQTCPDTSEVVFRAVSPHGHVYWEIEPKNMGHHNVVESSPVPQNLRHIPNPNGVFDATNGIDPSSRQSSSRYSDNHPLISGSSGGSSDN